MDRISIGGMAEIFRAKAKGASGFEKIVAIKRILPQMADDQEFVDMFIDEAKTVAQLSHANICQIFEFGQEAGTYFIALELVEGKDLKQVMLVRRRQGQAIPLPMVLTIMGQVCEALEYAHNCKTPQGEPMHIVHRDVSPQNVLVSYLGSVKLIDFGIAKAMGRLTKTSAGNIKGKFSYMSPEQVSAKPTIDARSDIFACGTVLWEALTNQRLFKAENEIITMQMVRKAEIQPPSEVNPDLPKAIDRIVLKSLARDPDERYSGAGELLDDLEQFASQSDNVCTSRQLARWMKEVFAADYKKLRARKESEDVVLLGQANIKPEDSQPSYSATAAPAPQEVSHSVQAPAPEVVTDGGSWAEPSYSGLSQPAVTGPGTGSYSGSYPGSELSSSYSPERRRTSKAPLYFGIVLAAILMGAAAAFFLTRPKEIKTPGKDAPAVAASSAKATASPAKTPPAKDVPEKAIPEKAAPEAKVPADETKVAAAPVDDEASADEPTEGKKKKRRRRRENSEDRAAGMEAALARATAMAKGSSDEGKTTAPAPPEKNAPPAKPEPRTPEPPPKAPAPPAKEEKPTPPPAAKKGRLIIASKPWAKVIVDGRATGLNTPIPPNKAIKLSPGVHWVTLEAEGKKFSYKVVIKAGELTRMIKNLPLSK